MEKNAKKCLLIWAPFLTIFDLPLGIPFLTAYLRNKGVRGVDFFDLNIAYLKRLRFFSLCVLSRKLNRMYYDFVGSIVRNLKRVRYRSAKTQNQKVESGLLDSSKKDKPLWEKIIKKIITYPPDYFDRKINELLDHIKNKEKGFIPWSLESIINFDFEKQCSAKMKKIYQLLPLKVKNGNFSLIGISVIYPEQLFFAFLIARTIKERCGKDIYIALGGAQITKHINHIIKSPKIYDFVDFFITDDGEEPLAQLLEALPKQRFSNIPNLHFKSLGGARGYERSNSFYLMHPKDFPVPDFTNFDLNAYGKQLPILASKGCFWSKCNFCTYATMHEKCFSICTSEKMIETIKTLKRIYGVSNYKFVDDALPPRFMRELAHRLSCKHLDIKWESSIMMCKEFADPNFCKALKKSSLFRVSIGFESISPRILNLMNKYHKNITDIEAKGILAGLKAAGIHVSIHIIFGFPTETVNEARKTLSFLIKNKNLYDSCMFQPFCLEDNTPIFNNPEKFGITKIYKNDKNSGKRLGYRYEIENGMSQKEAMEFTYKEVPTAFKKADISAKCYRKK